MKKILPKRRLPFLRLKLIKKKVPKMLKTIKNLCNKEKIKRLAIKQNNKIVNQNLLLLKMVLTHRISTSDSELKRGKNQLMLSDRHIHLLIWKKKSHI